MYSIGHMILASTATERWAAVRRMSPRSAPQEWFVLLGVAVMLVLLVLLIAISFRRHQQSKGQKAEKFNAEALRRDLSARERQILLAIAVRSGLRRTYEIFRTVDAFNRGATQLLAECAQTRTPQENAELKEEVSRLREKLGFRAVAKGGGAVVRRHPTSRDIPLGKHIELTGRRAHEAVALGAEVLRNDEIELVVTLPAPLESKAGDSWLARYCPGLSAWEFRTSTVRCAGNRLTLSHSEQIHFVNRRRFPRVPVRAPAVIAHLPFLQSDLAAGAPTSGDAGGPGGAEASPTAGAARPFSPVFVEGTLTELAGPGLRIETKLPVQVDDRVLVVFRLAQNGDGTPARQRTVAAIGRVRHGRDVERGVGIPDAIDRVWEGSSERDLHARAAQPLSIAVELTGLTDEEIEEVTSLTNKLSAQAPDHRGGSATESQETSTYATTAP